MRRHSHETHRPATMFQWDGRIFRALVSKTGNMGSNKGRMNELLTLDLKHVKLIGVHSYSKRGTYYLVECIYCGTHFLATFEELTTGMVECVSCL